MLRLAALSIRQAHGGSVLKCAMPLAESLGIGQGPSASRAQRPLGNDLRAPFYSTSLPGGAGSSSGKEESKEPANPASGFATTATDAQPKVELHMKLKKEQIMGAMVKEYSKDLSYSHEYAESVRPTHKAPKKISEHLAYWAIQGTRSAFDLATGYKHDKPQTEQQWLRRCIFLETVAGVPGMVAGTLRHLRSLRLMKRDQGWIGMLLDEAENERMHLLTFMEMRQPNTLFRWTVIAAQGVYYNIFFISYLISPKFCHSIVGYLEEEAVKTYTHLLADIDSGHLWKDHPAPAVGISYWKLKPNATMRDLVLAIRADEACHSHVNHKLSEIRSDDPNPFLIDPASAHPSPGKKD